MKNKYVLLIRRLSLLCLSALLSGLLGLPGVVFAQATGPVEYQSKTITFPAQKTPVEKPVSDSGPDNERDAELQKINLVKYTTLRLSPALIKMGQRVNALLKQDLIDINTVRAFESEHALFLEYIEHELNSSDNKSRHIQLIALTALLIGPPATAKLLDWGALFRKQPYRLRAVIHALSNWSSTKQTDAFVYSILGAEVPSTVVIPAALLYQAWNKNQSGRAFTGQYSVPQAGTHYQYLSLYLAGALGDKQFLPFIMQALENKPPAYQQYYLLLALSKLLNLGDYTQIVQGLAARGLNIKAAIKNSVQRQAVFVQTTNEKSADRLNAMLDSVYEEEQKLAIDYLIKQRDYMALARLINTKGVLGIKIYHQALFAGVSAEQLGFAVPDQAIHSADSPASIEKEKINDWPPALWLLMLVGAVVVGGMLFFVRGKNRSYV